MKVLLNNGHTEFTLDIPFTCAEIQFEQFIDFTSYEQRFFKANEIKRKGDESNEISLKEIIDSTDLSIEHLIQSVSYIVDGDIDELPFTTGENIGLLIEEGYILTLDSLGDDLSVLKLYAHCINIISTYEPALREPKFVLEWNSKEYTINRTEAVKSLLNVPMTAGELITTLELQRKTLTITKKKGDRDGNLAFNLGLQEVAILLRKKGEKLPSNRRKRIKFIDERVRVFRKLPMDVILDVRFFLLDSMIDYLKTRITSSSLNHQRK